MSVPFNSEDFDLHGLLYSLTSLVAQMLETWVGKIWRRKWQPTPVLLPGKFLGQRSLVGYSSWGRKEWDMTEQLQCQYIISLHLYT